MATRSILATATLALATLTMIPEVFGQEVQIGAKREGATASDGIRTDRLTARQLQAWRSIERIVQAVDGSGRPLHPKSPTCRWRFDAVADFASVLISGMKLIIFQKVVTHAGDQAVVAVKGIMRTLGDGFGAFHQYFDHLHCCAVR